MGSKIAAPRGSYLHERLKTAFPECPTLQSFDNDRSDVRFHDIGCDASMTEMNAQSGQCKRGSASIAIGG